MSKRSAVLVLASALIVAAVSVSACGANPSSTGTTQSQAPAQTQTQQSQTQPAPSTEPTPGPTSPAVTKLVVKDLTVGTGATAKAGNTVTVNYTGWLNDGTKFDSSFDRNEPFSFTIGQNKVIQGWEQGVVGMKVGGTRRLIIPPDLGYGAQGAGGVIPPNATLIFDVQLLSVQ